MKKKDIYEVTIKIFGIIAACKFIEFLIAGLTACIAFYLSSAAPKPDLIGVSQTYYIVFYIFSIVLFGLFSYFLLFKTDKILSLFRLIDSTDVTFQIEKKTIYHIGVLFIGFFMLTYSGNQLMSNTFSTKSPITTEQTSFNYGPAGEQIKTTGVRTTETSPSTTKSMTVNYINYFLIALSILMILKSRKLSTMLMPKENDVLID